MNGEAAGFLLALALHKRGFPFPLWLVERDPQALAGPPEPFFPDQLSADQLTLLEPMVVKEWDSCLIVRGAEIHREARRLGLLSLEQLAAEVHAIMPPDTIRWGEFEAASCRRRGRRVEASTCSPGTEHGWVRSSLWHLDDAHGLSAPVLQDGTLSTDSILQYLPLADNLLQVRQFQWGKPPAAPAAPLQLGARKLLQESLRPLRLRLAPESVSTPKGEGRIVNDDLAGDLVRAAFQAADGIWIGSTCRAEGE